MRRSSQTFVLNFRLGACAVESAIVLPAALFILFSILDLGLATIRYNTLAEASRRIARQAILHGSLAPAEVGAWGPLQFIGNASDGSTVVSPLKNMLPTMSDHDVNVDVTWPDGDNSPRDRVHVEVTYLHQPLLPFLANWGTIPLRSATTMHIVN